MSQPERPILGIHHVTAIAGDPQTNVDFYAGLLGLRLVKKTVNFDDPSVYHLYYADAHGSPGSVMTFFPWPNARRGSLGTGQTQTTVFAVPAGSLGYWCDRLAAEGLGADEVERFGRPGLKLADPDGLRLELVESAPDDDPRPPWTGAGVPAEHAIRGFDGVRLLLRDAGPTAELLEGVMGFERVGEDGRRVLYASPSNVSGSRVELMEDADGAPGRVAAGSVHHVAFRVEDDDSQLAWSRHLASAGHPTTEVKDRQYFHSIYYREPGGVLFEIATDPPGFDLDEDVDDLGSSLKLPPWLEGRRERIEQVLPPLREPATRGTA